MVFMEMLETINQLLIQEARQGYLERFVYMWTFLFMCLLAVSVLVFCFIMC